MRELSYEDFLASASVEGDYRNSMFIRGNGKIVFCYELIGWEAMVPSNKQEILSWKDAASDILKRRQQGPVEVRGLFVTSELEPVSYKTIRWHEGLKRLTVTRPKLSGEQYAQLRGKLDEHFEAIKLWHNERRRSERRRENGA